MIRTTNWYAENGMQV